MQSIRIKDLRKVILIRKDLATGYTLSVSAFRHNITVRDYERVNRVIKSMEAK
jgi:hypothetical protein